MQRSAHAHTSDGAAAADHELPSVLVVDDDDLLRDVFRRGLERSGYQVVEVHDAESALEALAREAFDIVVSDITMPGLSGIDLIERMGTDGIDVPVVLVTGQPCVETATKAVEHQVLRYLSKPVTTANLVRVVDEAVRLHGLARAKRLALDNEGLAQPDRRVDDRLPAAADDGRRARNRESAELRHDRSLHRSFRKRDPRLGLLHGGRFCRRSTTRGQIDALKS